MKCDYASCNTPATTTADGWNFCRPHLTEHQYLADGLELPDLPRNRLPVDHGTEGGYKAHRRRGEQPCSLCAEASRVASMLRNERYSNRWHRSEAS